MAAIEMFNMEAKDLEDMADSVKSVVLQALVKDNLLETDMAESWSGKHTVILRKKSFFRTLTDAWKKEPEKDGLILIVVESK